MNTIYSKEWVDGSSVETDTGFGHEDRDEAIIQAVNLASNLQASYIKENKRVYLESGKWGGRFVINVVGAKSQILAQYSV